MSGQNFHTAKMNKAAQTPTDEKHSKNVVQGGENYNTISSGSNKDKAGARALQPASSPTKNVMH